jgi:hypothetical protein
VYPISPSGTLQICAFSSFTVSFNLPKILRIVAAPHRRCFSDTGPRGHRVQRKKMLQCKEPKHVALVISLFQEAGVTMVNEPATDRCPHCSTAFEILCVKFRPGRTAMVAACPNCAIAFADDGTRIAGLSRPFQTIERVMDWLNRRFRYILAFLLAAVIVAALLRHGFHIYGGLTPDQIREDSLIAIPAVILLVVLLRWRKS